MEKSPFAANTPASGLHKHINLFVSLQMLYCTVGGQGVYGGLGGQGPPRIGGLEGWSPPNIIYLLALILIILFLHTFQMFLSNKVFFVENIFFSEHFSHFLRIFWNAFWSSREQSRSKTKFFVENFWNKNVKLKFYETKIGKNNRKIVFAYISDHSASFGTKK